MSRPGVGLRLFVICSLLFGQHFMDRGGLALVGGLVLLEQASRRLLQIHERCG